jgi:site-specific DNA-methyltransferase (adenine-specific)
MSDTDKPRHLQTLAVLGDFRTLAPSRPASLVVTDPPYNIGHDYGPVSDRLSQGDYLAKMEDLATWAFSRTLDDAHLFVVHYPEFFFANGWNVFVERGGWRAVERIAWVYPSNIGHSERRFTRASRDVWHFAKGEPFFDSKADPEPYKNPTDKRVRALIENGSKGRAPYDWWEIDLQKNVGADHAGYATQLPRPLLRRIILSATRPGELVVDPFAGTGSTISVANELGREGWGCDENPNAPSVHRRVFA